jgi:uncharacterized protein YndB with AHSA1/START domain
MSFTNFTSGNSHSFRCEYLEIIPNELLKYTDQFDDPNIPGQMLATIQQNRFYVEQNFMPRKKAFPIPFQ